MDDEELRGITKRVRSLVADISSNFDAIDQQIQDLQEHWVGESRRAEFFLKAEQARTKKESSVQEMNTLCETALATVPTAYFWLFEHIIAEMYKVTIDGS